jgi:DNA-binding MarR family transcriptional regulator
MNRIMGRYNASLRDEMAALGLTTPKMRALAVLSVIDGPLIRELAVYAVVEQSTLSRALDQLAARRADPARPMPADSRATRVFITDAGRAAFETLWPHMAKLRAHVPGIPETSGAPSWARCRRCSQHPQARLLTGGHGRTFLQGRSGTPAAGRGRHLHRRGHPRDHQGAAGNGVGYVGGYQGAPISHLMDVLADAEGLLAELGVRFEANASRRRRRRCWRPSVHYPIRGAVTFKGLGRRQRRLGRAGEPRLLGRHRRRAGHRGRGLRRRLLDHAGAQPRLRDEVAVLAAGPAPEPALASSRRWATGSSCPRRRTRR